MKESSSDQATPEESMLEGHSPGQVYYGFTGMNKMGNTRSPVTGNIDPQFSVNQGDEMEVINYAGMHPEVWLLRAVSTRCNTTRCRLCCLNSRSKGG
jgi:hypothetical protein